MHLKLHSVVGIGLFSRPYVRTCLLWPPFFVFLYWPHATVWTESEFTTNVFDKENSSSATWFHFSAVQLRIQCLNMVGIDKYFCILSLCRETKPTTIPTADSRTDKACAAGCCSRICPSAWSQAYSWTGICSSQSSFRVGSFCNWLTFVSHKRLQSALAQCLRCIKLKHNFA